MGKVREKGLRRGKTAFCRDATHPKTDDFYVRKGKKSR